MGFGLSSTHQQLISQSAVFHHLSYSQINGNLDSSMNFIRAWFWMWKETDTNTAWICKLQTGRPWLRFKPHSSKYGGLPTDHESTICKVFTRNTVIESTTYNFYPFFVLAVSLAFSKFILLRQHSSAFHTFVSSSCEPFFKSPFHQAVEDVSRSGCKQEVVVCLCNTHTEYDMCEMSNAKPVKHF